MMALGYIGPTTAQCDYNMDGNKKVRLRLLHQEKPLAHRELLEDGESLLPVLTCARCDVVITLIQAWLNSSLFIGMIVSSVPPLRVCVCACACVRVCVRVCVHVCLCACARARARARAGVHLLACILLPQAWDSLANPSWPPASPFPFPPPSASALLRCSSRYPRRSVAFCGGPFLTMQEGAGL